MKLHKFRGGVRAAEATKRGLSQETLGSSPALGEQPCKHAIPRILKDYLHHGCFFTLQHGTDQRLERIRAKDVTRILDELAGLIGYKRI